MAFGRDDVCEHGSLERKCDICALVKADRRIAILEDRIKYALSCIRDGDTLTAEFELQRALEDPDMKPSGCT